MNHRYIPKHLNMFLGYSTNIYNRLHGSSGGVGTGIFQYLLDSRQVDAVIGVGFDKKERTKAVYQLVEHSSRVSELAGSKYVYMPLPPLLELVNQHRDKTLAVVVEPCFVKPIRKLAPHCKFIMSFFCGYNRTSDATDYLIRQSKIDKSQIQAIEYRGGPYPGGFTVHTHSGTSKSFKKEHYELVDLLFLKDSCHRCSLFISDRADIVLGDAWIKKAKNMTLILINTNEGDHALKTMHENSLVSLYDIEEKDVLKMHAHNLKYKNEGHSFVMKAIVSLFNNKIARKIAPFRLLGFASKIRRAIMVGIDLPLKPVQKYGVRSFVG
ncbi:MAG: Coenzyme F420 hydrogenase/dehydrogenase, beta subunit C-terminal domain [Deltaproteobacteria bacterium]|nr:Coenzyme F420 hydrogenase/dehydrogenase, beta subunit C-terminal domain [Deltaproteobacteria bacterium]